MSKKVTKVTQETPENTAAENIAAQEEVKVEEVISQPAAEAVETTPAEALAAPAADEVSEEIKTEEKQSQKAKVLSPGMTVLKRFFRSKLSVVGLVFIVALFLFAFLGPLFSPWRANGGTLIDTEVSRIVVFCTPEKEISYVVNNIAYEAKTVSLSMADFVSLGKPSAAHWLGTTIEGYDVLTRLMYGGRVSLTIGFVVVLLETLIGVVLGGLAGYFGKWVDNLIMRIVDILSCIPSLPIMLILSVIFQEHGLGDSIGKLYLMMMVLCLIGWTGTARLVRGQILSLREQEFMLAAKASGLSTASKIFKHLMPNVIPQLIVSMTLGLGSVILMEATLGFLGIGAPLGTATWGNLVYLVTQSDYIDNYANLWMGAGICITLAILAFNFVGDGLRDAFDPKMKR